VKRLCVIVLAAMLAACGSSDDLDPARIVEGVVEAPDGEIAAARRGFLRVVRDFLVAPLAAVTGIDAVGAGVAVRLEALDNNGDVGSVLATVTTLADGTYGHALASSEEVGAFLQVSVGEDDDDTLMRAFVSSLSVDINPATEAAVRLVLDSEYALERFSADDLQTIQAAVNAATANVPAGSSIAVATDRAEERAADDTAVQAAIDAAGRIFAQPAQ
jgi:hypothetical protein